MLANARELGGDAARIAVVGESAGGNMALAIGYNATREGVQPLVHQVLVYPVADYGQDTESYREMTEAQPLNSIRCGARVSSWPSDGARPESRSNSAPSPA